MPAHKSRERSEFGDFQTPDSLAAAVCRVLTQLGIAPTCILEPTCGRGSFVNAAAHAFPTARVIGVDINPDHLAVAHRILRSEIASGRIELWEGDFFRIGWNDVLDRRSGSWLILGNPPWVTSSELGALNSTNVPVKANVHGRSGIDALTGKSNFDISEWMVLRYLDWLRERGGWIAVLIKTAVARKLLLEVWKSRYPVRQAAIYRIDAMEHFGAAVDACLFVLTVEAGAMVPDCPVFESLHDSQPVRRIGFHDGLLISDVEAYRRWRHLSGGDRHYLWRSGIKHDCAKVMELTEDNGYYWNGLNEVVTIEDTFLFPLLKSSDVGKNGNGRGRYLLVTQQTIGENTARIRTEAPDTWAYLQRHATLLAKRGSSIYRNRPPFSIFGVGDYCFAPWKVAISGFYKRLHFVPVGPIGGRPAVFDDTVYFLACHSRAEAEFLADILNSRPAHEFYESMTFWSDKRPITSEVLRRLSLANLAAALGRASEYESFVHGRGPTRREASQAPLPGLE